MRVTGSDALIASRRAAIAREKRLLAPRLRSLRLAKGLAIDEAALRADIQPGTLAKTESAHSFPRPTTLRKLAEVYGTTPEQLQHNKSLYKSPRRPMAQGARAPA